MRPQVGQVINNKYRLIRLVGDGGMGSVYEARHEVLGTTVALKFLHPELSRRSGLVQRFLQEARVSAHIQSPHVVRVTDVDQSSAGLAFIVMEYLEGKTLQNLYEELYRAGKRLSYADALEYALQMLEGVEAAHRAGIIHRDLKPDNVMITKGLKGETLLKLLDFGIAKLKVTGELDRGLTRPGVIMGTPEYMAPEQAYSADAVDSRADIFSLGVMIFEMIAGRRPVGGDDPHQIAAQYLSGQVAKLLDLAPHADPQLAQAVHRAMAPMPKDRFATVAELRAALEPAAIAARVPSAPAAATPAPPVASPEARSVAMQVDLPKPANGAPARAPEGAAASPVAAATPATNPGAAEGYRSVPKTLPPEDEGDGAPAPGTPLGGFSVHDQTVRATPIPAEVAAQVAQAQAAAAAASAGPVVHVGSGTVSSPPPAPAAMGFGAEGVAPAANVAVLPSSLPSTANYTPAYVPEVSPRPGGTDVGANGSGAQPYAGAVPGTATMDPLYSATPTANPPVRRKPRGGASSLLMILLLATGVAGAVVGGVYIAHQRAKGADRADDPPVITTAPATNIAPPPTTPTDPPVATPPPPPPPTPTPTPPRPTAKPPGTTKPPGTATSTPTGTPSSQPPFIPTSFPPLIIPTAIPTSLPLPFPPPGGTTPPASTGPGPGGTTTSPPPTSTGGGRPRITIPPRN